MKDYWFVVFDKAEDGCHEFSANGCIREVVGDKLLIDYTGERYAMRLYDAAEYLSQDIVFYADRDQMNEDITNGLSTLAKIAVRHIRHHLKLEWSA